MKNIILCDLDGTLADIRHRRHFVERLPDCKVCDGLGKVDPDSTNHRSGLVSCPACNGVGFIGPQKPNWPAFFKACVDDTPLETTIRMIDNLNSMDFEIWVVSGRSDEVAAETTEWLHKHVNNYDRLIMRKQGDYTPDDVLKKSWLGDGTIPKDRVFCVFEDRDRVVQMWRDEGLICYQVAEGDF
jgi:hypothetical protein